MLQRIIWMQLFLFGILSSFSSCKKQVDAYLIHEYHFKNDSNYGIAIDVYNRNENNFVKNSYNITKGIFFSQQLDLMFDSKIGIIALSDSVVIIFEKNKKATFCSNTDSKFNILKEDNFIKSNKSNKHVIFTYTFTDNDYNNADTRK